VSLFSRYKVPKSGGRDFLSRNVIYNKKSRKV
jgi:hypothetical protein